MSNVVSGDNLKSFRKAKGWNQLELARFAGLHRSIVSRLERDLQYDLKASVLVALARALGTSIDSLVAERTENTKTTMVAELEEAILKLNNLPVANQLQLAAILRAYVTNLPNTNE